MYRIAIPAALLLLAGCAMSPADQARQAAASEREQAKLDSALKGLQPVSTERCIPRSNVTSTRSFDNAILFEQSRNKLWRNDMNGASCLGQGSDDILVFRNLTGSQYCAGDIVTTRARTGGFITGSCSLGEFTRYEAPKR